MPRTPKARRAPARPPIALEQLEAREQPSATMLGNLNTQLPSAFRTGSPFAAGAAGATLDGRVLFAADDGVHPAAIWASDGTAAGTQLVAALPGDGNVGSAMAQPGQFTAAAGKVFFTYADGVHGYELWETDGTAAGTHVVVDLVPGLGSSTPDHLTAVGDRLVFTATVQSATWAQTLFSTDGTAAGTVPLAQLGTTDVYPGFVASGGKLYYASHALDPATYAKTAEIWVTDGTAAGTKVAAALPAGADTAVTPYFGGAWVTAAGSKLFFAGRDDAHGVELWESDGTTAGTHMVANVNSVVPPNPPGVFSADGNANPQDLTAIGGEAYFVADDGIHGQELWRSDGTAPGTAMVIDLSPTVGSDPGPTFGATGSRISGLTAVGSSLYFSADDGTHGPQFYASDGTAAGTHALTSAVHTAAVGTLSAPDEHPIVLDAGPGRVLFSFGDRSDGRQVWTTDGTAAGTHIVKAIGPASPPPLSYYEIGPTSLGWVGGRFLFAADDGQTGRQLWTTDGTAAGTALVTRINPTDLGSGPTSFVAAGSLAYFTASTDGDRTTGVYATDGASAPTLLKALGGNVAPSVGPYYRTARDLTASGHTAYFVEAAGAVGFGLWRTDGTAAGTKLLKSIDWTPGPFQLAEGIPHGIDNPTDVDGTLFFTIDRPATGQELWKTDGTAAGTVLVHALSPASSTGLVDMGGNGVYPVRQMTAVGNRLFFVASEPGLGEGLWVSDGTTAGTTMPFIFGDGSPTMDNLTALGGKIYFTAQDATHARHLWSSDGTAAGTVLVAGIGSATSFELATPTRAVNYPENRTLVAAGGRLYFSADDAEGTQLWTSDGTAAGTRRVTALPAALNFPGGPSNFLRGLTAAGSKVYFSAGDAQLGVQLWASDGTAAGTATVGPIGDGSQGGGVAGFRVGADPMILAANGGRVWFSADDGVHGRELWTTDGTAAGTALVRDFFPGRPSGVSPSYFAAGAALVNGRLVLAADDGAHGAEPWSVTLDGTPPPAVPTLTAATPVAAVAGASFNRALGAIDVPVGTAYRASIVWGDGQSSTGIVVRAAVNATAAVVSGQHVYAAAGTYAITARLIAGGEQALKFTAAATVSAAPAATDARFYVGRTYDRLPATWGFVGAVATVQSLNPQATAADFRAAIDWGDGRATAAAVRQVAPGRFEVDGSYAFASPGRHAVAVTVVGPAGRTGTAVSTFDVDPLAA